MHYVTGLFLRFFRVNSEFLIHEDHTSVHKRKLMVSGHIGIHRGQLVASSLNFFVCVSSLMERSQVLEEGSHGNASDAMVYCDRQREDDELGVVVVIFTYNTLIA